MNRFLSMRCLQPLSRLSYCTFLTHHAVLSVRMGRIKTAEYLDVYVTVNEFLADVVMTLMASLVLHLLVEAPALQLVSIALPRGESRDL